MEKKSVRTEVQEQNIDQRLIRLNANKIHAGIFLALASFSFSNFAHAHEAWLLTPQEVMQLATRSAPELFSSISGMNVLIALFFSFAISTAIILEAFYSKKEQEIFSKLKSQVHTYGTLVLRVGLAIMLLLAAFGLSPRNGTALWAAPTLFVPDLQLRLLPGQWSFLATVEAILGVMLLAGIFTRFAALGVIALCFAGLALFGQDMIAYFGHFFAPALFLLWSGSGPIAISTAQPVYFTQIHEKIASLSENTIKRLVFILTGGTFIYLGIFYKALQPTLLIAILEHGEVPTFGIPYEYVAYIMAFVEVIAGLLLACSILVRPIAVFLICAMTFFTFTLAESPFLHTNIYALSIIIFMLGPVSAQHKQAASSRQQSYKTNRFSLV